MAVQYDYAYSCVGPESGQIGLRLLRDYVIGRWDQVADIGDDISDLGIYNCRQIRGGGRLSIHAQGRAWDSRWENRLELVECWGVLLANADKLNIQRIIDYVGQRIWTTGVGWQNVSVFSPGGNATHIERNWAGARDTRSITSIIGNVPITIKPERGAMGICLHEPSGGYYLFATDGGVFAYGGAKFHGSLPAQNVKPAAPVIGMAVRPQGDGYWLASKDGGVYSFGEANRHFHGSLAGKKLNAPITDIESSKSGKGYYLSGADGGVFTFGDADFEGSAVGKIKYP